MKSPSLLGNRLKKRVSENRCENSSPTESVKSQRKRMENIGDGNDETNDYALRQNVSTYNRLRNSNRYGIHNLLNVLQHANIRILSRIRTRHALTVLRNGHINLWSCLPTVLSFQVCTNNLERTGEITTPIGTYYLTAIGIASITLTLLFIAIKLWHKYRKKPRDSSVCSCFFGFLGLFSGFSVFSRFFNRVHHSGGDNERGVTRNIRNVSIDGVALQEDKTKSKPNNFPLFLDMILAFFTISLLLIGSSMFLLLFRAEPSSKWLFWLGICIGVISLIFVVITLSISMVKDLNHKRKHAKET